MAYTYEQLEALMTLKTRTIEPGVIWARSPEDQQLRLYWGRPDDNTEEALRGYRSDTDDSKRSVRRAVTMLRRIAREYERTADVSILAVRIQEFCSNFGSPYSQYPVPLKLNIAERRFDETLEGWEQEVRLFSIADRLYTFLRTGKSPYPKLRENISVIDNDLVICDFPEYNSSVRLSQGLKAMTVVDRRTGEERVFRPAKIRELPSAQLHWIAFSVIVDTRLRNHLTLAMDPLSRENIGLTPTGSIPTVYARLLLDVLQERAESGMLRTCASPVCENSIPFEARSDRMFCSDRCRKRTARLTARKEIGTE